MPVTHSYTTPRDTSDSREIQDGDVAKQRQQALVGQVKQAAERFGCGFDDIAGPVNARANEIKEERVLNGKSPRYRTRAWGWVGIVAAKDSDDVTALLCESLQTHLGASMPSGAVTSSEPGRASKVDDAHY